MNARNLIFLLSCFLILIGCNKEPSSATVTRRDVEGYLVLGGQLVTPPTEYADVLSPYRAPIEKIMVSEGQWVREGEVLMTLAIAGATTYYEQARQYVKTAETNLANARGAMNDNLVQLQAQLKALKARQAAGEDVAVEMGIIQSQVASEQRMLEANLAPYKVALVDAQRYLQEAQSGAKLSQIKAPIAGTVLKLYAQAGQEVGRERDDPVATICDLAALIVHAPLEPAHVSYVKEDTEVTLTFEGIVEEFDGRVSRVVTKPADGGVMYVAVISFDNKKGLVKPGAKVQGAAVKTGEVHDVLAVPTEAVDKDSSGKPVVKVLKDGKWMPTVVEVGLSGGGYTEIKSGLNEGDTIQVTP